MSLATVGATGDPHASANIAESIVQDNLVFFGIPQHDHEKALFSMLAELRGWAGMFHRMQTNAVDAPPDALVRILDFAAVQSILTRSSIEHAALDAGWNGRTALSEWLRKQEAKTVGDIADVTDDVKSASTVATIDQSSESRVALEHEFEVRFFLIYLGLSALQDSFVVTRLVNANLVLPEVEAHQERVQRAYAAKTLTST